MNPFVRYYLPKIKGLDTAGKALAGKLINGLSLISPPPKAQKKRSVD
jgi:hypothetical protein